MNETDLIHECLQNSRQAQFRLYDQYSTSMMDVCRRYSRCRCDAEDILQEGFIKVFRYLADFRSQGSFEGWMRKIMVTTAFNYYKKKRIVSNEAELIRIPEAEVSEQMVISKLLHEELLSLISELPNGYRNVFSLNTVEGYSHKEIGQMLNISENTSKSQLTRARMRLQEKVTRLHATSDMYAVLQSA